MADAMAPGKEDVFRLGSNPLGNGFSLSGCNDARLGLRLVLCQQESLLSR